MNIVMPALRKRKTALQLLLIFISVAILWNAILGIDLSHEPQYLNPNELNINVLNRPKYQDYDMVILFYTTVFGQKPNENWLFSAGNIIVCNISGSEKRNQKILLTDDKSLKPFANALIFHGPDIKIKTIRKSNKQYDDIYIFYSMESPANVPKAWKFASNFNLLMSYTLDADIPIPYLKLDIFKTWFSISNTYSLKENDVLWIGSNCNANNGRQYYLRELFKYIPAHSLGPCLYSNPDNITIPPRSNYRFDISDVVSKYKFYIAIENSNCKSYFTEKIEKAFASGTVPVVFSVNGIPEYDKILPFHSYINGADFKSAKDLAEYLKLVGSNEKLYNSFSHFKSNRSNGSIKQVEWNKIIKMFGFANSNQPTCYLCRAVNEIYRLHKSKQYNKTIPIDNSCLDRNIMAGYANISVGR